MPSAPIFTPAQDKHYEQQESIQLPSDQHSQPRG